MPGVGACRGARLPHTRLALDEWADVRLQIASEGSSRRGYVVLRARRRCPRTSLTQAPCGPAMDAVRHPREASCAGTMHAMPATLAPADKRGGSRGVRHTEA